MRYNNWVFGGWVPASEGLWASSCSIQPWGSFRKLIKNKTENAFFPARSSPLGKHDLWGQREGEEEAEAEAEKERG